MIHQEIHLRKVTTITIRPYKHSNLTTLALQIILSAALKVNLNKPFLTYIYNFNILKRVTFTQ